MKHLICATVLLLSVNAAHAKKAPKMSKTEAKEMCLSAKGADISKKDLSKCVKKAMRSGKV